MKNITILLLSLVLSVAFIACEEDEPHICSEKLSGYFGVTSLENYPALLTKVDGNKENYTKRIAISYEERSNLRIIGQFKTSNYGIISPDCAVEHGELGCEEVTGRITIIDLDTKRTIANKTILSEIHINSDINDDVEFDIFFPDNSDEYVSEELISDLNLDYYRMMLPNYILQFRYGLTTKEYELEIKYEFASSAFVDTIRFKIE